MYTRATFLWRGVCVCVRDSCTEQEMKKRRNVDGEEEEEEAENTSIKCGPLG